MDTKNKPNRVDDDVVVSLDYTLTVNGEVVDSTENEEPLQYIQGHGNIIPGLERELYGMSLGESKQVTVPATDAYGEVNPEAKIQVPREEFPEEIPLETGIQLQVRDMNGEVRDARIDQVGDQAVTLDFNHPLAGQELAFDIKVVDLRSATEEELEHGHVHGIGGEEPEEEEYEDFDEDDEDDLFDEDDEDDLEEGLLLEGDEDELLEDEDQD